MTQVKKLPHRFKTIWQDNKVLKSKVEGKSMTIPGQALTNKEHTVKARQGLSDQTVKLIYDPHNTFPDLRAKDLVDRKAMLQGTRALVNQLKTAGKKASEDLKASQLKIATDRQEELEKSLLTKMEKNQLQAKKGGL